jgi:hypothetical protein
MRRFALAMALVMPAVLAPLSLMAAPVSIPALSAQQAAAVAQAEGRGAQMFAYDRAAWLASDAFQKDAQGRLDGLIARGLAGYVVEPGEGDALLVTFFGHRNGAFFALARYTVAGRAATGGLTVDEPALSPLALRLADARDKAVEAMGRPGHGLCTTSPPNTLVLPLADGAIAAYVLSSTTDAASYPAGGHYRFDFDARGTLVGERAFMKSCITLSSRDAAGGKTQAAFVSHLLDPQPTEIHAFVSRNLPVPLIVVTVENRQIWGLDRGRITPMGPVPGASGNK